MAGPVKQHVRSAGLIVVVSLFSVVYAAPQFQFSSFSGPVSGLSKESPVPRVAAHFDHKRPLGALKEHDPSMQFGAALDYDARPDYTFAYGVQDPLSGNMQSHQEKRDGDMVLGRYRVLESDGSIRTVTYTSDPKKGFQADVHRTPADPAAAPPENYEADPSSLSPEEADRSGYQHDFDDGQDLFKRHADPSA